MNRVIKFRAKRKLNGAWVYGSYVKSNSEDWCIIVEELDDDIRQSDYCRVITSTVGAFTGLLDKNKKEIYEGDILKFYDKPVAVVEWQDFGGWSYRWIDATYITVRQHNPEPFFRNIHLNEVIGNIHQNTELLETV